MTYLLCRFNVETNLRVTQFFFYFPYPLQKAEIKIYESQIQIVNYFEF